MALAQGLEMGVLAGLDVLQAAGYLRDLGHPNTSREVIRITRLLRPDDGQVRDRAEDLLASLPFEVLRNVAPPAEELDLDQGRLLEGLADTRSDKSEETEQYIPSPPRMEPAASPASSDHEALEAEDEDEGQQPRGEDRPVGRVSGQQRQGSQGSPQREESIDYR